MRRLFATLALTLLPLAARAAAPDAVLEPLTSAIDDAQTHAAALADHAAHAAPTTLTMATDDEQGALSAVIGAEAALARIMRATPAMLLQQTDVAITAELNRAQQALGSYLQARLRGNRNMMRAAAADAVEALGRADALVSAERTH